MQNTKLDKYRGYLRVTGLSPMVYFDVYSVYKTAKILKIKNSYFFYTYIVFFSCEPIF